MNCLNGLWCLFLPEFMHNFTQFEPVENNVENVSRLVLEAGLDKATAEDVTGLLDSHGQQLSNEDFETWLKN